MSSTFNEPVGFGDFPNRYWTPLSGGAAGIEAVGTDANGGRAIIASGYGIAAGAGGIFHFHAALGTELVPLPLTAGKVIGAIGWRAYDGSGFNGSSAAVVVTAVEGSDGNKFIGTDLSLETTPIGGSPYRAYKMYLRSDGRVQLPLPVYSAGALNSDMNGYISSDGGVLAAKLLALDARLSALEAA